MSVSQQLRREGKIYIYISFNTEFLLSDVSLPKEITRDVNKIFKNLHQQHLQEKNGTRSNHKQLVKISHDSSVQWNAMDLFHIFKATYNIDITWKTT